MPDALETTIGILVFGLLVFLSIGLHEWGHFVTARRFGAKVTEFMIGFGPALFSKRGGETRYGVKLIPFGGYVRITGMYPPARGSGTVAQGGRFTELVAEARRQSLAEMESGEESRMFYRLPVHQRVIVMLAGPFMNLLLAVGLFTAMLVGVGLPQPTTTLESIVACTPSATNLFGLPESDGTCPPGSQLTQAARIGLRQGDRVLAVAGVPIDQWETLDRALDGRTGATDVTIERDGRTITAEVSLAPIPYPVLDEQGVPTGATQPRTLLGVRPRMNYESQPLSGVPGYMWDITSTSVQALFGMPQRLYELGETLVSGSQRRPDSPVSVVGVTRLGGEIAAAEEPMAAKIGSFLALAASLNLFLFLFNLLPVLPLDGGHVAAALWEGTRRRWALWRNRPDPGPVDTARLLPITYSVAVVLISVGVMVIWADIVRPISLGG